MRQCQVEVSAAKKPWQMGLRECQCPVRGQCEEGGLAPGTPAVGVKLPAPQQPLGGSLWG